MPTVTVEIDKRSLRQLEQLRDQLTEQGAAWDSRNRRRRRELLLAGFCGGTLAVVLLALFMLILQWLKEW